MKKTLIVSSLISLALVLTGSVHALDGPGGGGGTVNPGGGGTVGPGGGGQSAMAACGPAQQGNGTFPTPANRQREWPTGALCTVQGTTPNTVTISSVTINYSPAWASNPAYGVTTSYNRTCTLQTAGGPSVAACNVGRVSWCGTSNGQSLSAMPTSNLCAYGTPSAVATTPGTYSWTCFSSQYYNSTVGTVNYTDSCSATRLVAGCGPSQGQLFMNTPTTGLCNGTATPSTVLTTGVSTYNRTCGYPGGIPVACSANKAIQNSQCSDPAFAAADYAACQLNGTCLCHTVTSTGASSSSSPASGTYSGNVTFRADSPGWILGLVGGAGGAGALTVPYSGPSFTIGVGAAGVNKALPGAALDVAGLVHFGAFSGATTNQRLMITDTGLLYTVVASLLPSRMQNGTTTFYNGGSASNVGIGTNTPTEKLHVIGNVKANSFLTNSDKRLKSNIQPLTDSLAKVLSLKPVSFAWNDSKKNDIGFIAQNVEQVFPELVVTDNNGFKSVAYSNLLAPVVQAVKEISSLVDTLSNQQLIYQQQRIQKLEARMATLQNLIHTQP